MHRGVAITLRWVGRVLILLAPYVLFCSLFFPTGVQVINPLVCSEGLELDNKAPSVPGSPDDGKLEIVCVSDGDTRYSESAGRNIALACAALVTLGLVAIYFSQQFARTQYRPPSQPPHG